MGFIVRCKGVALGLLGASLLVGSGQAAFGQCKDEWVTKAVNQVRQELKLKGGVQGSGTTGECNVSRYGGGSWSGYDDLVQKARMSYVCDDAWIGQAVAELNRSMSINTGGGPAALSRVKVVGSGKSGECNPKLYGNGRWNGYADLKAKVEASWRDHKLGECRDPWLTSAIKDAKRRLGMGDTSVQAWGELSECNSSLYAGGNWSSQQDLNEKVYQTFKALKQMDMTISFAGFYHNPTHKVIPFNSLLIINDRKEVLARPDAQVVASSTVLSQQAKDQLLAGATSLSSVSNIVAQGGGNIVAQGGGNIVAQGGGNIVAQGGGNIVAQGGGNILGGMGGQIVAAGGGNAVAAGGAN